MRIPVLLLAVLGAVGAGAAAQQSRSMPLRNLGPIVAKAKESFGLIIGVWQFGDGSVLVNDGKRHRILLLDSALAQARVIGAPGGSSAIAYGENPSPFIPFVGDSVLFPDIPSTSLLVITRGGRVTDTLAPPKYSDYILLQGTSAGADAKGRIVYRGAPRGVPGTRIADSAPIVRGDFASRATDTLALIKMPVHGTTKPTLGADGLYRIVETLIPVTSVDVWTVHSDGTIAVLRGGDYHIDWISADGSRMSSPKMPFEWRRITAEDKRRIADSAIGFWNAKPTARNAISTQVAAGMFSREKVPMARGARVLLPDNTPGIAFTADVPFDQIPNYYPPVRPGAMLADRDGNLWILPDRSSQSRNDRAIYDVVNRRGEITERVKVPDGRVVVGFGPKGSVFLMSGDLARGFNLERARFR